jgi:uncharacterized repeat protein (TIGR01451 family)
MNELRKNALFILIGLFTAICTGSVWSQTPSGTAITNTAVLSYDGGNGMILSIPSDTVVTIVSDVDLEVTKTTNVQEVGVGDTVLYEINVKNIDDWTATKVTILDSLPRMLSFIGSEPTCEINGNAVKWQIQEIGIGETVGIQLTCLVVKADYSNTIENIVIVRANEGQKRYSNKAMVLWKPWPDVELSKSVASDTAYVGDVLTYRLDVQNTGPLPLTHIQVRDTLPTGLNYISSSMTVDTTNQILVWHIDDLDRAQKISLEYQAVVTPKTSSHPILNIAYLTCAEGASDTSSASTTFLGYGIGLEITKEAADTIYSAGDTITYDLILGNSGVRPGNQIVVRDTLPGYLEYLGSTHDAVLEEDNILVWQFDHLQAGFCDTLHVTTSIRIPIENQTVVDNIVWAGSSEGLQDSSRWRIRVNSLPNLLLKKSTNPDAFPGDTLVYSLICSNTGTATAFESVLRDTLPEHLLFVDATESYTYDTESHSVRWQSMNISSGYLDTLYIRTIISTSIGSNAQIVNTAWLSNQTASTTACATCETQTNPITIFSYKTVDKKQVSAGDTLTYRIHYGTLTNHAIDSVFIVDIMPQEIQLIQDASLRKSNAQLLSYDPVTNQVYFYQKGFWTAQKDSIELKAVVKNDIEPGIHHVENKAIVWTRSDTAYTEEDPRTNTRTMLIQKFLSVKKSVNRKITEVGGILTYQLIIENKSKDNTLAPIEIQDILPEGFRYMEGTSRMEDKKINDPDLDRTGKHIRMLWTLSDTLRPGKQIKLLYRITVGLSAKLGEQENRVTAFGLSDHVWIQSEEANATVLVLAGAFDERGFIFGKVYEDLNRNGRHDNGEPGCKGIELVMEDGTRIKTDAFGKYSIPNVEEGQHVLRLNERTLPKNKHVLINSSQFLGDSKSRIVLVSPGGMAKANFAVESDKQ